MTLHFGYVCYAAIPIGVAAALAVVAEPTTTLGAGLGVAGGAAIGTAIGTAFAMAVASIGTHIWPKPFLDAKRDRDRVDNLTSRLTEAEARILEQGVKLTTKEVESATLIHENVRLGKDLADALRRTYSLAKYLMTARGDLHPDGGTHVPPLTVGGGSPTPNGKTVLIVEDDERAREAMATLIGLCGFLTLQAGDLTEAFAALDREPDVIVLDLMLPGGGDGIQVLRAVRDRHMKTRVVVATGKDEGSLGPVEALKPDAIIIKPYQFEVHLLPILQECTSPVIKEPGS